MPTVVTQAEHCFVADPQSLDVRNLSAIARPGSINLNDFGIGGVNLAFADLPECPPDFLEEGMFVFPTISLGKVRYADARGEHAFDLSRLKASGVSLFAQLAEHQFEDFARRWCTFGMCDVFRFRKNIPAQVDDLTLQRQTQDALQRFLSVFCPLCRQAVAESKGIYVLREWHEYCAA